MANEDARSNSVTSDAIAAVASVALVGVGVGLTGKAFKDTVKGVKSASTKLSESGIIEATGDAMSSTLKETGEAIKDKANNIKNNVKEASEKGKEILKNIPDDIKSEINYLKNRPDVLNKRKSEKVSTRFEQAKKRNNNSTDIVPSSAGYRGYNNMTRNEVLVTNT